MVAHFIRGLVIGVANIIPGVSGGTLALILGIYERMITAINNLSWRTLTACVGLLRCNRAAWQTWIEEMRRVDAAFLAMLELGALVSIVALAQLMTYLIEHFYAPTYGFFFGLVAASAWVPWKLVRRQSVAGFLAAMLALGGVLTLSASMSSEEILAKAQAKLEVKLENEPSPQPYAADHSLPNLVYMLVVGVLGISAMVLPGISGSFLLLLLGVYFDILRAIIFMDFTILIIFTIGNVLGLLTFCRFLKFALQKWHDITMSFLLGLVLGSLVTVWPFRASARIGEETVYLANQWPQVWGTLEWATVAAALAGGALVALLIWFESRRAASA